MNYVIDKKSQIPAYIQLYNYLSHDIVEGVYVYGTKLPSKRIIAEDVGVSVITVEHALILLNEEGYVQNKERSGAFVIYRDENFLKEPIKHLKSGKRPENISYDKGEFPFSVLARKMRKVLLDYGDKILVKSPNQGSIELREAICQFLARTRGIMVLPNQVIVGSGAEYLYGLIAQLFKEESIIAIEKPSYEKIRQVYETMGLTCDMLSLKNNGIDTKELEKTKAKVLHITPFNSFPSGVTADISKKKEYLRWAKERVGVLIEDNYDSELTVSRKMEMPLFSMDPEVKVIYLNTFSQTLAPSMRVGYMILPEELLKEFNEKLSFYSCTVPVYEQYVLAELLNNGDFERHLNRVRRKRRKQADI
ncbi:MAG: PLP-dependent aminotransferase family protein [Lachnospiraceae bacterium]|nr:PLP-dependent aminotransferase family protein [Lachnospiraceae bacterium]